MSNDAKTKASAWLTWGVLAVAAVIAGVMLPQLMSGESAVDGMKSKAQEKDKASLEYRAPALPEAPSAQAMLIRLALGTVIVLGLCVGTIFGLKRWVNPSLTGDALSREMKLIETLPLGNRCLLHLVHLGKQQILVGVDAGGVKSIVPLPGTFDEVLTEATTTEVSEGTLPFPQKSV
jgi:flagellar biogenesis protein FliO